MSQLFVPLAEDEGLLLRSDLVSFCKVDGNTTPVGVALAVRTSSI